MKIKAYGVHAFTALGAALGLWAIILTFDGYFQEAIWVLCGAAIVDSVDGALARAVDIHTNAPRIDGALMDNIIDFVSWTIGPLVWLYAIMHIPVWVLMICAFSSIFGFTNVAAKTEDNFFTGFPSFWNIVVLYIYLLQLSIPVASVILLGFAIAIFLPVKFIYPSKTEYFKTSMLVLGALYILQLLAIIILFDESPMWLVYSSFLFPIYYFGASFYVQLKHL